MKKHPHDYEIKRDDVAAILVESLGNSHVKNKVLVVESDNIDIKEALSK